MASQLYQVRNLYSDLKFEGFVLRAGKKARVRVEVEKTNDGKYHGTARLLEARGKVVAEADAANAVEAFEAVTQKLQETHFNFLARIKDEAA